MLRMIALDLDGTLLHDDKGLTRRSKNILQQYIDRGTHVVVASGRAFASLPEEVMAVSGIEYAITSNGVSICRHSTGEKIFHRTLRSDCAEKLLELIRANAYTFETFIDGMPYADERYVKSPTDFGTPEYAVPYVQRTRKPVKELLDFAHKHMDELDCIDLIIPDDAELRQSVLEKVGGIDGLYITSSVPHLIEISDESAGKGAAVRRLAEYLGIDPSEIAAFGNAENDVDMIRFAGIGVAVSNSPMDVKKEADYITMSNNEDGVAFFLEQLLMNE